MEGAADEWGGENARMDRIVIAFAHNAAREKAGLLLEQCGHPACASVRSGAEVLRMVRSWDGAVVVLSLIHI